MSNRALALVRLAALLAGVAVVYAETRDLACCAVAAVEGASVLTGGAP